VQTERSLIKAKVEKRIEHSAFDKVDKPPDERRPSINVQEKQPETSNAYLQ
jgi:hypothetical protein